MSQDQEKRQKSGHNLAKSDRCRITQAIAGRSLGDRHPLWKIAGAAPLCVPQTAIIRELQLNNALNRLLNPPFWGTLKGSEVLLQNGGFRGLKSQCISLVFYFHATPLAKNKQEKP
ncbi:MAG: hypothetical protein KME11_00820 [Timaviella obliquedivisa GSE-PSE-MK23-08B]|jgi:hypothetical protein|nr:hypothetical protein [Timaviella obliquedivisa GSE-PSE-MK23-08B]